MPVKNTSKQARKFDKKPRVIKATIKKARDTPSAKEVKQPVFPESRGEIMSSLARFLKSVMDSASDYAYVAFAEPRFLDLFRAVLPDKNPAAEAKLVTAAGLMLRHEALLYSYLKKNEFPPVLIVGGLLTHGRGIGKFLCGLEQAVFDDCEMRTGLPLSEDECFALRSRLADAIDIRVFARSREPVLMHDRHAIRLQYDHRLYADQMHETDDLISRTMDPSRMAGAGFAVSAGCGAQAAMADRGGWRHVPWTSLANGRAHELHAYVRPHSDERGTYLFSTVRFYGDKPSRITSMPLFAAVSAPTFGRPGLNDMYGCLKELLDDDVYVSLYGILRDENPGAQPARAQLIGTFLAIADLIGFREDYGLSPERAARDTDIRGIAANYGHNTETAFAALLGAPGLCRQLAGVIRKALRISTARIPFGITDPSGTDAAAADAANDWLEQSLYDLRMRSEEHAYRYFDAPFLYRPERFNEYPPAGDGESGCAVGFADYMRMHLDLPVSDYGRVAAYLALADRGIVAHQMLYSDRDSAVYAVCMADERSMLYLLRKFSVFVPALGAVEKNAPMLNMTAREAVERFVRDVLHYDGACGDIRSRLDDLMDNLDAYLDKLHGCGQLFAGWNFPGLTAQEDEEHAAAQKDFIAQAKTFLK